VPKADLPEERELHEISRRRCTRMGVKPREPITAVGLRQIVDERRRTVRKVGLLLALRACADALAVHELPPELRALRDALDEYVDWLRRSKGAARRLTAAAEAATPLLDSEAETRTAALQAVVLTEEQRAKGLEARVWPSPESLRAFPRAVVNALPHAHYVVSWLHKMLQDLTLIDADPEIILMLAPPRTRMAQALAHAGYRVSEITTIIHPFAKTGAARSRARNAVTRRLALRDDQFRPTIPIPSDAPDAVARWAALDDAARFVAGGGHEGLVIATSATESAVEAEIPAPPDKSLRPQKEEGGRRRRSKR